MDTYRRLRFDQQFMFVYSARPGTPAAAMPDQLPQQVKVARMTQVVELQNAISTERNAGEIGTVFEVMVEGPSERDPEKYTGRARNTKALVFTADRPLHPGDIVHVKAETAHLWGFGGRLV